MKIKAIVNFTNKETNEIIYIDDVVDFEKKRAESAIKKGLAVSVETEKKEGKPKTSKKEKK